jgi:protein TonB
MEPEPLLNLAAFTLQACIIAVAAALVLGLLRIGPAGARYVCWRVALAACLTMPLVLQQRIVSTTEFAQSVAAGGDLGKAPAAMLEPVAATALTSSSTRPSLPWGWIATLVISVGVIVRGGWLAIGLARLRILRRRGVPVDDSEYADIQNTLGTRAVLLRVDGLGQPATFGVWRPVVLLPETLAESPAGLRRAVVTHELFHVQRRDWLWVLAEESLRSLLWFNPAIVWMTSRIQLAREELVDELTVLATGNRRAYIEALLAFADAGRVRPAPAFARRRQLFTRILRLSKERVMSSPRIVVSSAAVVAAVLATGWYASLVFPIVTAAASADATQTAPVNAPRPVVRAPGSVPAQAPGPARPVAQGPRSGGAPRPGPAAALTPPPGTKPITPENPIPRRMSSVPVSYPAQLRGSGYRGVVVVRATLDASGRIADVQRMSVEALGDTTNVDRAAAATAFFDAAADAVRQWRYQPPAEPPIAFFVHLRFDGEREAVATQNESQIGGIRLVATSDALRGELRGFEERMKSLRDERERLLGQYNAAHPEVVRLNGQISEIERELERARNNYGTTLRVEGTARLEQGVTAAGARVAGPGTAIGQPIRVGGNIKPPAKTTHVNPVYPEIARSARVQGVVIMETVIDEHGRVADARVLRSIPLLDQAALDAVRQWQFTPTLLNGVAVPVVMTVTIQFTLPEPPPQ